MHKAMIKDNEEDIVNGMNDYHKLKQRNAKPIQKFCRGIINKKKLQNRNKNLRNRITSLDLS